MFYVYILKLNNGNIYTGFTADLRKRFAEHSNGKVTSTKNKRPVLLVYYEAYMSKVDARSREQYLKSGGKAKNTIKTQIQQSLT